MKKIVIRLIILAVVAGVGYWGWTACSSPCRSGRAQIATTKVRKGDVVVRTFARGELRAVRSATLIAPNLFGTVQVTQMASARRAREGKDLIVEFDDSEVQLAHRRKAARTRSDRRADQEGAGRSRHPQQPGSGGTAARPVLGPAVRTRSEAQRTAA